MNVVEFKQLPDVAKPWWELLLGMHYFSKQGQADLDGLFSFMHLKVAIY